MAGKVVEIRLSTTSDKVDKKITIPIESYFETSTKKLEEFDKLKTTSEKKDFIFNDFKSQWKFVQVEFIGEV